MDILDAETIRQRAGFIRQHLRQLRDTPPTDAAAAQRAGLLAIAGCEQLGVLLEQAGQLDGVERAQCVAAIDQGFATAITAAKQADIYFSKE